MLNIKRWWSNIHYHHLLELVGEIIVNSIVFIFIAGVAYSMSFALQILYPNTEEGDFYCTALTYAKQGIFIFDFFLFFFLLILSSIRFMCNISMDVIPSSSRAFINSWFRSNPTRKSGIISILPEVPGDEITKMIENATYRVDIIQTWLANESKILDQLFIAAHRGCKVRILLLTNDPPAVAESRSKAFGWDNNAVPGKISKSLETIKETWRSKGQPASFEVRLYSSNPSINLYRIDNRYYFGPLLVNQHGLSSITFKGGTSNGFAQLQVMREHFEALWQDKSTPYQLR